MNYAEAVAANDLVAILSAKKRIFQDANEDGFQLILQITSPQPFNDQDALSSVLINFTSTVLPQSNDAHKLLHRLDNVEIDFSIIASNENSQTNLIYPSDFAFLKISFPKPWDKKIERLSQLLNEAVKGTPFNLKRIFPEKKHTVVMVRSSVESVVDGLIPQLGMVVDIQIPKILENQIEFVKYALLVGPENIENEVGKSSDGVQFTVEVLD